MYDYLPCFLLGCEIFFVFQVFVQASDGGNPVRSSYSVVTFDVNRNLATPVLVQPSSPTYTDTVVVMETTSFSDLIYTVVARDADPADVSHWEIDIFVTVRGFEPDPPENCHLNVKKLPKTWHFFKKIAKNFHFFQKNCQWHFKKKKR